MTDQERTQFLGLSQETASSALTDEDRLAFLGGASGDTMPPIEVDEETPEGLTTQIAKKLDRFNAERAMGERSSLIPSAAASAADQFLPNAQRTAEDLLSPATSFFRRAQQGALHDTAMWEGYESALANPALALQRGEPSAAIPDAMKGLLGQRPAQFGDVFQEAGLPAPIASALGLALVPGGAEAEAAVAKTLWNLPGNIRRFFAKTPMGTERLMTLSETQVAKLPPEERQTYLQLRNAADAQEISTKRAALQQQYQETLGKIRQDQQVLGKAAPGVASQRLKGLAEPFRALQSAQNRLYKSRINEALADIPENNALFTREDLHGAIANKYLTPGTMPDDPTEYRALLDLFDEAEIINANEISAQQVLKMSDDLSRGIGVGARNKSRAYVPNEVISSKLRDVLLDLLESRGANVREAKAEWAQWVPVRNLGLKFQTPSGPSTLMRIIQGRDPIRGEHLAQLESLLGESLQTEVKQVFTQLDGLTQQKVIEGTKQLEAKRLLGERIGFLKDSQIERKLRMDQMARHHDNVRKLIFYFAAGAAGAAGAKGVFGAGTLAVDAMAQ